MISDATSLRLNSLAPAKDMRQVRAAIPAVLAGYELSVVADPRLVATEWAALEATPTASAFQSFRWCEAWSRIVSPSIGEQPLIVVGHEREGEVAFILPLALRRIAGLRLITWLGQTHANYNLGIWRADLLGSITPAMAHAVLEWAARNASADAVSVTNQPGEWLGYANPLVSPNSNRTASDSYQIALEPDFTQLYARKFSGKTRASLKRKDRRLAELGPVSVDHLADTTSRVRHLEEFFAQKAIQFAEQGVSNVFADPTLQQFYLDLARRGIDGGKACAADLSLMRLRVGDETAATFNGIRFGDRFYLLTLSLTDDEAIKRCSPGLRLMREQIAFCCAEGVTTYDFGTGQGDHKSAWDATSLPMWDSFIPFSLRARLYGAATRLARNAKRAIKSNPRWWHLVRNTRRLRAAVAAQGLGRGHGLGLGRGHGRGHGRS